MELIVFVCLAAAVVWFVWIARKHDRESEKAAKKATLDQAWRIVLADPHYEQRRQFEERRHEVKAQLRKEGAGLPKSSG